MRTSVRTPAPPPVISAWTAISPLGVGDAAHTGATRPDGPAHRETRPAHTVHPVPDFDPRAVLGKAGTRAMDRVSALAIATVGHLLREHPRDQTDPAGTAVVLATNGSPQAMRDFTRDSLLAGKPFHVNPAVIPSGVPNCAAGLVAIWHTLTGPNTTISMGRTGGLSALGYARRLLANHRADRVIVGATEEYSPTRAMLELQHDRPDNTCTTLGEGCAVFLLEPPAPHPADRPVTDVLCVTHRASPASDPAAQLPDCVRDALNHCRIRPEQVWAALGSHAAGEPGRREQQALDDLFGTDVTHRIPPLPMGDTASATSAFQIAAALAAPVPTTADTILAVTTVDITGTVACAILRRRPVRAPQP
ncbi:beta-ketoacyl synthase N-terminal-like domain-containing protein [Streptomyces sp. UNOB3_S3]|uniref:beta-ketoacyl synthase N-terminal-like domain-containing protein n=1 Tax=Streptomyces sp. UNOB3_S3 TaxID=2871682 RepID=UPI001E2DA8D4|nr:beta-ketoacyl synthase N-terminal-like domain-containing protein [Streptomyces sp. UNOB3_S3]MCC3775147.1 3-oxoacyl-ACP synthase [Streptomyces sp. UNOB3_S3]